MLRHMAKAAALRMAHDLVCDRWQLPHDNAAARKQRERKIEGNGKGRRDLSSLPWETIAGRETTEAFDAIRTQACSYLGPHRTHKLETFTMSASRPEIRMRIRTGAVSILALASSAIRAPVAKSMSSVTESKTGIPMTSPTEMSGEAWYLRAARQRHDEPGSLR